MTGTGHVDFSSPHKTPSTKNMKRKAHHQPPHQEGILTTLIQTLQTPAAAFKKVRSK